MEFNHSSRLRERFDVSVSNSQGTCVRAVLRISPHPRGRFHAFFISVQKSA